MSNQIVLPVVPTQLPSGFCPTDLQSMLNGFSAAQTVTFPNTFTGIIVSATKPTDTTQAWLQLDTLGRPVRVYGFAQGAWMSLHPVVPGFTMLWTNALPTFTTFDGGDANAVSSISGPMWEQVTDFNARSPMGVGTLPSGQAVALADQLGEETHVLTATEGTVDPNHIHTIGRGRLPNNADTFFLTGTSTKDGTGVRLTGGGYTTDVLSNQTGLYNVTSTPNVASPDAAAHNNLHPILGCYFLRRTARMFYVVP